MPPAQNQNTNQNQSDPVSERNDGMSLPVASGSGPHEVAGNAARARPAIRTMKSDAEEIMKTEKPSLIKIAAGATRRPIFPGAPVPQKRRIPLVMIGAIIAGLILLAGIGFGVWYAYGTWVTPAKPTDSDIIMPDQTRLAPPTPYFATETSRTITIKKTDRAEFARLMADTWHEKEREGTVKRIIIKIQDGPTERFATLGDFFEMWRIAPPQELVDQAGGSLMVFMYAGATGNRIGFAVRTDEPERAFAHMLRWEPSLLAQATPLFCDERAGSILSIFEDRTGRNIDWRYMKLSQDKDLGIGYLVFPVGDVFVFTTSKEATEATINRLFDAH